MPDLATLELRTESTEVESATKRLDNLSTKAGQAESTSGRLERRFQNVNRRAGSMGASFASLASRLGPLIGGLSLLGSIAGSIRLAGQFEQTSVAMETMLGSASRARAVLDDLEQFASRTPFQFQGLAESVRVLIALGFNAEAATTTIRTLGDAVAAMGGGQPLLDRLVLALGQMQAKGKATGEEMRQLAEAGIPGFKILADALGVTVPEAMKSSEQGAISAQFAINALLEGMNARFSGAAERLSTTILGQLSTLRDNIAVIARAMGRELFEAFSLPEGIAAAIEFLKRLSSETERLQKGMRVLSAVLTFVAARFVAIIALGFVTHILQIAVATAQAARSWTAFGTAISKNPIGLIATGLAIAASAFVVFNAEAAAAERGINLLSLSQSQLSASIQRTKSDLESAIEELDRLRERASNPIKAQIKAQLDNAEFEKLSRTIDTIRILGFQNPATESILRILGLDALDAEQDIDALERKIAILRELLKQKLVADAFVEYHNALDGIQARFEATAETQREAVRENTRLSEQLVVAKRLFTDLSEAVDGSDSRLQSAANTVANLEKRLSELQTPAQDAERVLAGIAAAAAGIVDDVRPDESQKLSAGQRRVLAMEERLQLERSIFALDQKNQEIERDVAQFRAAAIEAQLPDLEDRVAAYREEVTELLLLEDSWSRTQAAAESYGQAVGAALADALFGVEKFEDALRSLAEALSRQIISQAFGTLAKSVASSLAPAPAAARGGVLSSGRLETFASGGVLSGPIAFPIRGGIGIAGEAGPEAAFAPLVRSPRTGRLAVEAVQSPQANSPMNRPINIYQNIYTPDADSFRRSQKQIAMDLRDKMEQIR